MLPFDTVGGRVLDMKKNHLTIVSECDDDGNVADEDMILEVVSSEPGPGNSSGRDSEFAASVIARKLCPLMLIGRVLAIIAV